MQNIYYIHPCDFMLINSFAAREKHQATKCVIITLTCANHIKASTRHQGTNEVRVASLTHGRAARGREQRATGGGRGAAVMRNPATAALSGGERRTREEGLLTTTVWTCGG